MKPFFKKAALGFVSFAVLFSSFFGYFAPTAKAQAPCPPNADQPYCDDAIAACENSAILNVVFHDDENMCVLVIYEIGRIAFTSPVPLPWYDSDPREFGQMVFDPTNPDEVFGERYTYAQVKWIFNSIVNIIFPPIRATSVLELFEFIVNLIEGFKSAGEFLNGGDQASVIRTLPEYGLIGQTYYTMSLLPKLIFTDPIASGVGEVKYLASKLNIASPALAQGLGYDKLGLGTIRSLWLATRNIAYLIAVLILIVAGFMVIFRTKISAQASVTVQMIIPKLLISLFLVTFSYAIAGFVIDMIYVVITAILGIIYFSQSATGITIISDLPTAVAHLTGDFNFVGHFLTVYIVIAILLIIATIALTVIAAFATLGAAAVIAPIMGLILGFFAWSIYLWARILGQLVLAYVSLILLVIAGPLMIITDILPTSPGGFRKWILCVIGNASVFVSYAVFAILSTLLFETPVINGFEAYDPSTHISSQFDLPLFPENGYPTSFFLQYFIWIGFMSAIPNFVNSIKSMFCKGDDMSTFIESTVKDTVGQFSSAGQKAGETINKGLDERWDTTHSAAEKGMRKAPKPPGSPSGGGGS